MVRIPNSRKSLIPKEPGGNYATAAQVNALCSYKQLELQRLASFVLELCTELLYPML